MSWSHSCLRWNTRMAPVSGRPPKLTKWVLSAELVSRWLSHRRNIAERPHWTRSTLPSLRYVSSHFLFDSSVLSHWYFIVPLRNTRLTILTSKELRYNSLSLSLFILFSLKTLSPRTWIITISSCDKALILPVLLLCELIRIYGILRITVQLQPHQVDFALKTRVADYLLTRLHIH